ncbi:MAG: hypothetical protein EP335_17480 [Alphaproteobacteria bacterium]|nr:MAG: hypothetical protein EP335_17480 [Alphaproteobacteria bacterium]
MLANRVREYTTTVGTGDITLAGAMAGFVGFADAFADGDTVSYVVEDGDNYEIGTGTFTAGRLLRTLVQETLLDGQYLKAGAVAISLSGNARVFVAVTAGFLESASWQTDTLLERTPGAGVTADGVKLKDRTVSAVEYRLEDGLGAPQARLVADGTVQFQGADGTALLSLDPADGAGTVSLAGPLQLTAGSISTPAVAIGTGSATGIYSPGTDEIGFTCDGVESWRLNATGLRYQGSAGGPQLVAGPAGVNLPTLLPNSADTDSGLAGNGNGELYLVTNGTPALTAGATGDVSIARDLVLPAAGQIRNASPTIGQLNVSGSSSPSSGGNVVLFGPSHLYLPSHIKFRIGINDAINIDSGLTTSLSGNLKLAPAGSLLTPDGILRMAPAGADSGILLQLTPAGSAIDTGIRLLGQESNSSGTCLDISQSGTESRIASQALGGGGAGPIVFAHDTTDSMRLDTDHIDVLAPLALAAQATPPVAIAGKVVLFLDAADGALKARFGNGVIKTLADDV